MVSLWHPVTDKPWNSTVTKEPVEGCRWLHVVFNDFIGSIVDKMMGRKFVISGMTIEVVADAGERWETRNITTRETVFINKYVLQSAIKLGKAEELVVDENKP